MDSHPPNIRPYVIATVAVLFALMAGIVHADQSDTLDADIAIANGIFERKQAIRDIFRWADKRARAAVENSDVARGQIDKHKMEVDDCFANAKAKFEEDPTTYRVYIQSCHGKKNAGPRSHSDEAAVIEELRTRFIRERIEQERELLAEELLRHMQDILEGSEEGPVI